MSSLCKGEPILEIHYDKIYDWASQISSLVKSFRSKVRIKYIKENNAIPHDFYVFFNEIGKMALSVNVIADKGAGDKWIVKDWWF